DAGARAPTVAVALDRAAEPVSATLADHGINCWAGDFYAVRPLTAMGVDLDRGVLRLSLVHYTSAEDVARLISALDKVL
ncbi:MAG: nitrogen fixation protein NifS, partial [Albidovulum sp.]